MATWGYIALVAIGIIIGIVLWEYVSKSETVFRGHIRIKQRGRGNIQKPGITTEIQPQTKRGDKKAARQQARIVRRNERRKKKDLRKLEN